MNNFKDVLDHLQKLHVEKLNILVKAFAQFKAVLDHENELLAGLVKEAKPEPKKKAKKK